MFIFLIWHTSQTSYTIKLVLSIGGLVVMFLIISLAGLGWEAVDEEFAKPLPATARI
jgi:hypothetical protein